MFKHASCSVLLYLWELFLATNVHPHSKVGSLVDVTTDAMEKLVSLEKAPPQLEILMGDVSLFALLFLSVPLCYHHCHSHNARGDVYLPSRSL